MDGAGAAYPRLCLAFPNWLVSCGRTAAETDLPGDFFLRFTWNTACRPQRATKSADIDDRSGRGAKLSVGTKPTKIVHPNIRMRPHLSSALPGVVECFRNSAI